MIKLDQVCRNDYRAFIARRENNPPHVPDYLVRVFCDGASVESGDYETHGEAADAYNDACRLYDILTPYGVTGANREAKDRLSCE